MSANTVTVILDTMLLCEWRQKYFKENIFLCETKEIYDLVMFLINGNSNNFNIKFHINLKQLYIMVLQLSFSMQHSHIIACDIQL